MAGTVTVNGTAYPFDEEIFAAHFNEVPDLVTNAMLKSGALVKDAYIESLIANGSNTYTIPFYSPLDDEATADNYDGVSDMTTTETGGDSQTGVVYGRMHAFEAPQFIADFTTANPMASIAAKQAKWWQNKKQKRLLGICDAVLEISSVKSKHVVTKSTLTPTTLGDAAQEIFGDARGQVALAIMHSAVAREFEDLEIVDFLKYTDPTGVQRELRIGQINGINVIEDDGVPVTPATTGSNATPAMYSTYLFGYGAIKEASAPVTKPVETWRNPTAKGGIDYIGTRLRETIHPNGFSFNAPSGMTSSPTDAQLANKSNWTLAYPDVRAIPIAKLITPGHSA